MSKPSYNNIYTFLRDLQLWMETIRDWVPDFETRMANRERRYRRRHLQGKISTERLNIELKAIEQKRASRK